MMGPVQENDTNASVNAIKKMLSRPVVFSDFWSILLLQEAGNVSSNAPKKEAAKTTSSRQKKILKTALVDMAFSALGPKSSVTYDLNWTPITYSVKYNGNGSNGGSTATSSHTYDTAKNLTARTVARLLKDDFVGGS